MPWDYLHVADAARAIVAVATGSATGVFDVGSGETVCTRAIPRMLRAKIDPHLALSFGARPERDVEIDYLKADTTAIRSLGWKPQIDLSTGLDSVIQDWKTRKHSEEAK